MEELMTAETVAKLLNVNPSWVKKKSRSPNADDRIPSIKLGKMVRYRLADITTWLNAQCYDVG